MAILSALDEFHKNQAGYAGLPSAVTHGELVAINATQYLSAVKDAIASRDWGAGEQKKAYFGITSSAACNPGTSLQVQIVGSDTQPSITAGGTNEVVLADSGAILTAKLVAGSFFFIGYLKSGFLKRYLAAKLISVGGVATAGAIVCGLADKNSLQQSYGDTLNSL